MRSAATLHPAPSVHRYAPLPNPDLDPSAATPPASSSKTAILTAITAGARWRPDEVFGPLGPAMWQRSELTASPRLGSVSEKYESGGGGAGVVSTGAGDPKGGVSYGVYQLSARTGTLKRFLAEEGAQWAQELSGTNAAVSRGEFEKRWKAIAARCPQEFAAAQRAFIARTHYEPVVRQVRTSTGLDVALRSVAVQEAVWSVAVQHGAAADLIIDAVRRVSLPASHPRYDQSLIHAVYDRRMAYVEQLDLPPSTVRSNRHRYHAEQIDILKKLADETL